MINDYYFDKLIGLSLMASDEQKQKDRKSSGKLSASILGWPLQWQLLKHYKAPTAPFDEYTLRKFTRGNQVEDWVVSVLEDHKLVVEKQKFLEYRGAIGYADIIIKHNGQVPQLKGLEIPHEVKSVTSFKYKRITKIKEADPQHQLQAGLYALALGSPYYAIDYIESDDLRLETYIYETKKIKPEIDLIIDQYELALKSGQVPIFIPRYDWQANVKYSNYPDWQELKQEEIDQKLKELKNG